MAFDQGAPSFGLSDCKIATWSSAGTYGTVTDIMSVQLVGVTLRFTEAVLVGDDTETATAARAIGGTCQVRFGGISTTALAIILGRATSTISSVVQQSVKGGNRMPYFGLVGKALVEEGSGDIWVYVPKMKVAGDISIAMLEYGNFAIPEVSARMVDEASYGILNLITHPTDVAITVMPPANIAVVSS
jgi:hypothetical protein